MTDLVIERDIAAPPDVVFRFLVEPAKLVQWLGRAAEFDPTPGGAVRIDVTGREITEGHVVEVVPDERVVFTWGWIGNPRIPPGSTTVSIDLTPTESGTRLVVTHAGLPDEEVVGHRGGWEYFLPRLLTVVVGDRPGPIEPERIGQSAIQPVCPPGAGGERAKQTQRTQQGGAQT